MTTPDYKALCAEPVEELGAWIGYADEADCADAHEVVDRARTALAAEAVGPSDEELMELMPQTMRNDLASVSRLSAQQAGLTAGVFRTTLNVRVLAYARAVLARWGSAPRPIPVSERPWERDGWCDHRGLCWWALGTVQRWTLCFPNGKTEGWMLPASALPAPAQEGADG